MNARRGFPDLRWAWGLGGSGIWLVPWSHGSRAGAPLRVGLGFSLRPCSYSWGCRGCILGPPTGAAETPGVACGAAHVVAGTPLRRPAEAVRPGHCRAGCPVPGRGDPSVPVPPAPILCPPVLGERHRWGPPGGECAPPKNTPPCQRNVGGVDRDAAAGGGGLPPLAPGCPGRPPRMPSVPSPSLGRGNCSVSSAMSGIGHQLPLHRLWQEPVVPAPAGGSEQEARRRYGGPGPSRGTGGPGACRLLAPAPTRRLRSRAAQRRAPGHQEWWGHCSRAGAGSRVASARGPPPLPGLLCGWSPRLLAPSGTPHVPW